MSATDEVPGWEYVSFCPQRGIGPALVGEGLGPHEVVACPTLPEVGEIRTRLAVTASVTVSGESGSGKSITAYQAAYGEASDGWEVVRLASDQEAGDPSIPITGLRHRTLAVVDNAQALPPAVVRRIQDLSDPSRLRVVVVTTERTGHGSVVRIAANRAVATIAAALRPREGELLPLLRELDPTLGEDYLDVSLGSRLATAASEQTPWRFGFVLRGGWREARSAIAFSVEDSPGAYLWHVSIGATTPGIVPFKGGFAWDADTPAERKTIARNLESVFTRQVWP